MSDQNKPGFVQRQLQTWKDHTLRSSIVTLLVIGAIAGIVFGDGFNFLIEQTNSIEFCTSCHTMQGNFKEYKDTVHWKNASGVRAGCPDCHVPPSFGGKIHRKMEAAEDVWGEIIGVVDTPAKFEKRRMKMATEEWARFKANDSVTCRRCHSFDAMSQEKQGETRFNKHMKAKADGQTCIDCHKGVAHHLPKEYRDPNEDE
ncbi:MAG: NapC/NirT family cytochrome c [Burkholderiaceae bacterium]|jgi:cytochrome c-type protein NapC|nr:NapC/NirT family cytochrome c [Burkholderiaceae bacterium]